MLTVKVYVVLWCTSLVYVFLSQYIFMFRTTQMPVGLGSPEILLSPH